MTFVFPLQTAPGTQIPSAQRRGAVTAGTRGKARRQPDGALLPNPGVIMLLLAPALAFGPGRDR